jgi:20S proteasome alpha/beta subunit
VCAFWGHGSIVFLIVLQVTMIGVNFEENHIATGFGNHMAQPLLRAEWHENLTFEEGVTLLEKCMRVLLYRDRSAVNKFQVPLLFPYNCMRLTCYGMRFLEK